MKKIIKISFFLALVTSLIFIAYVYVLFKDAHFDKTHKFAVTPQKDWSRIDYSETIEEVYVLGTLGNDNKVKSLFFVIPFKSVSSEKLIKNQITYKEVVDNCNKDKIITVNPSGFRVEAYKNLYMKGYICTYEAETSAELLAITNLDLSTRRVIRYYYLSHKIWGINQKNANILIASYPKGNMVEEEKLNKIISGYTTLP